MKFFSSINICVVFFLRKERLQRYIHTHTLETPLELAATVLFATIRHQQRGNDPGTEEDEATTHPKLDEAP